MKQMQKDKKKMTQEMQKVHKATRQSSEEHKWWPRMSTKRQTSACWESRTGVRHLYTTYLSVECIDYLFPLCYRTSVAIVHVESLIVERRVCKYYSVRF